MIHFHSSLLWSHVCGHMDLITRSFVRLSTVGFFLLLVSMAMADVPSSSDPAFDLRDYYGDGTTSYSTSVKSQYWGTCWIHATMASLESSLLVNGNWASAGMAGEPNLAEYHLDKFNGFTRRGQPDDEPNNTGYTGQKDPFPGSNYDEPLENRDHGMIVHLGGDYRMAAACLTQHGAVAETSSTRITGTNYPARRIQFGYGDYNGIPKTDNYDYFAPRDIDFLTLLGTDEQKRHRIKESLVEHGAVGTCIASSSSFFSGENFYQPPSSTVDVNHAVTIIGWDDNHITQAPLPGAWICKNSWGSSWNGNGHFWVSYEDKYAARHETMGGVAFRGVQRKSAETVYSRSLHGWQYDTSNDPTGFAGAANGFVTEGNELLTGVGFYTLGSAVAYTIQVYGELGSEPSLLSQQTGSAEHPGFHYIELGHLASLNLGETFYVVLETSDGVYAFDASSRVYTAMGTITDPPYDVYSASARGESFYRDGGGVWHDFLDYDAFSNLDTEWNDASWNFAITCYTVERIFGDANLDGRVDVVDAQTLATNWGQSGDWKQGDFSGDALVDAADASILAANWGYGTSEATTVPEPGVLALLLGLGGSAFVRRGRWWCR